MMNTTIPAVYENGTFWLLEQPSDLREQQRVEVFYFVADDTLYPPPLPAEEDDDFVDKMMGIWAAPGGDDSRQ